MLTSPSDPFGALLKHFRKRRQLTQQQLAEALGLHRNTIGRWEEGSFLPESKALLLELARHLCLDEHEARQLLEASLLAPTPIWSVPFPRNPFFTGREETLTMLHAHLGPGQQVALTRSYALHGLGGIGKTQLALEYAYRYTLEYHAIFWITAETVEQVHTSLLRMAQRLALPECTASDQQRIVAAVQRWLETHGEWLLIWDNLEDLDLLPRFLPSLRQGAILITTRRQALGTVAHGIELLPMAEAEGMLLLLRRAKILGATATSKQVRELAASHPAEYAAAQQLVTALGGLPLALDQAGAYIEETQCSLAEFLALFQRAPLRLLQERDAHAEHPASVVTTFTLAFEQVRQDHTATELLTACCFLAPEEIPEYLFTQQATLFPPELQQELAEPFAFLEIVKKLLAYALIQRHPDRQTLSVHRLVQAVLRERMSIQEQLVWRKRMLRILNAAFPEATHDAWETCEHLLPHVLACAADLPDQEADWELLAELLRKAADYLRVRANYKQAEPLYQRALHLLEQIYGPEHLSVACLLHNLAILSYRFQGKYERAVALGERALRIREQALEPLHLDVAASLNLLANFYTYQRKYEQAELFHQRALSIREQTLGLEHPDLSSSLNNLAILYHYQGKYEQAEPLYQRTLSIRERALGLENPLVAEPLNNLALLYTEQGKYEQAEPLCRCALSICEQALGPEHPYIIDALNNLALLYTEQGKYEQAEPLYQRALSISEQALEAEHHKVAESLNGLANLYQKQGKDERAEVLYQRALSIREQHLGQHHPETAQTLSDLAVFRHKQGNIREAMFFAECALKIRSQVLGDAHPNTERSRAYVAQLRQELKRAARLAQLPPSLPDPASGAPTPLDLRATRE